LAAGLDIVVDSSVWIDYYRNPKLQHAIWLDMAMDSHRILLPNIVILEIARGMPDERTAKGVEKDFAVFARFDITGTAIHLAAAQNYRLLREKGYTVRGSIDLLIGTWCIESQLPLLHNDRDFDAMEQHLGLKVWRGQ
jgi:predicted nucleic acid-binding protein